MHMTLYTITFCVEDEEEYVPKPKSGSSKRIRGTRTTKMKQPAAKRQKNADTQSSSLSVVSQPVLRGPHLSASSSSSDSEDEFDSLVKNWDGEISVDTVVEDTSRTKVGRKRTRRGK